MTVFKDVRTLVNDAITAAVALLKGKTPAAKGTYNNGKIDVPAIQSAGRHRRQGQRQGRPDRLRLLPGHRLHRPGALRRCRRAAGSCW